MTRPNTRDGPEAVSPRSRLQTQPAKAEVMTLIVPPGTPGSGAAP